MLQGVAPARRTLFGYYGEPGTRRFKIMARQDNWKYIFFANGGREQLFDLSSDPHELSNLAQSQDSMASRLRQVAEQACDRPELRSALEANTLRWLPFEARPNQRIYQFDRSRGITGFAANAHDVIQNYFQDSTTG
jgi:choline-sulfatase